MPDSREEPESTNLTRFDSPSCRQQYQIDREELVKAQSAVIRGAIDDLPLLDRDVALCRFADGWSIERIAAVCGHSAASVQETLIKCEAFLRQRWQYYCAKVGADPARDSVSRIPPTMFE